MPTVNAAGQYNLQVTDMANGCTATTTVSVLGNTTPPDLNIGPAIVLPCAPPSTTLQGSSATPGALFDWMSSDGNIVSGKTTATPLIDAPGLYSLTVTDPANGCTASGFVTVSAPILDFPSIVGTDPSCTDPFGSILFFGGATSQGPFLYSIDNGASFSQDSLFANLPAGIYQTVVQGAGGCEVQASLELPAVLLFTVELPDTVSLAPGETVQLYPVLDIPESEIASVVWAPGAGLNCTDCLNPVAAPLVAGNYLVTLSNLNGCTASATVFIKLEATDAIYIPNAFSPDSDGPNKLFLLQTNRLFNNFEIQVFDRWGGLLFQSTDPNEAWDGRAKGQRMNPGVYAYFIRFDFVNSAGETETFLRSGDVLLLR
jgi:gliding motility-associated-like protein